MRYKIIQYLLVIFVCLAPVTAAAKDYPSFGPITVRNQNPIYLQNLGLEPTKAVTLPKGSLETRLDLAYSNIFEKDMSTTNEMDLDMELMRLALHTIYGLRDDIEVGFEIPLYTTWGGFLDSFIQDFHKFFGLPNGGRSSVPNNQYNYKFYSGGNLIYDAPSTDFAIGDVRLRIKNHVLDETRARPAIAWFGDIKFPTGNSSRGLSNGGFDFGLGMALEKSYRRLHSYLNLEYIVSGANVSFDDFMHHYMFAYTAALELTLLDSWSVIAQVNGSTPLLANTGMESWDGVPLDLVIGFRGCEKGLLGGNDLFWQFGFSEDVLSEGPSVDFTVFLSIGFRFYGVN